MASTRINIGIFGGSFCCPNFGVGALTISQCNILDSIASELQIKVDVTCYEAVIREVYLPTFNNINVTLDTHTLNYCVMRKKFSKHDLIIELYGGDSFADIYSLKGFVLGCLQRLFSINRNTKYVMAPQTIGPFNNTLSYKLAIKLMRRAEHIFCRDKMSLQLVPDFAIKKTTCVTDMAFRLPYKQQHSNEEIGLNVSGLLWNGDLLGDKKNEYQKSIVKIIEYCVDNHIPLTLVPHVNDLNYSPDGDYETSKMLINKYGRGQIKIAPQFSNPVDAKSYISRFKLFIGSRMHATIAAMSVGIPTLAIAYSKKFLGVYEVFEYNYVIERQNIDSNIICNTFIRMLKQYDKVKTEVNKIGLVANKILLPYDKYLKDLIIGVKNEHDKKL